MPRISLLALMLFVFVVWLALFFPTVWDTVLIWERSETFAHCFLILPICLYLVHRNWPRLKQQPVKANYWVLVPLVMALLLWLLGTLAQIAAIEQGAAFLILPLLYWLVLGNKGARVLLFPLLFWMFSVPEGEFLVPYLQDVTADITVAAIRLTGVPVYIEGLYIAVPGGLFEVAEACSGIRYLIASFTLGTLFAYITYTGWKKRLLFILFSIILPIIANGLRAFGIVMIAYLSDMEYATGVDHLIYGWVFFGLVIFIMFSVGNIWRDPPPETLESGTLTGRKTFTARGSLTAISLFIGFTLLAFVYKTSAESVEAIAPPDIRQSLPLADLEDKELWSPDFRGATTEHWGSLDGMTFYAAYYGSNVQGMELISSQNQLFEREGWTRVSARDYDEFGLVEITNVRGDRRLLAFTYVTDWLQTPSTASVKVSQALQALIGAPQAGMVMILSMPVDAEEGAREHLIRKATSFFSQDLWSLTHGTR
ncbi:exosortase A [Bowmanella dokdonensis]|uniref:Exosortase A n=1 Tax=Bowmanella dokdonensis TaxID=751969 RepID=A0A939DR78_9ALTE|nr:exosortase A [Bowmanella dokdonensis]MBN7827332.1 exosortase A [Bowmanella dokdonensis]